MTAPIVFTAAGVLLTHGPLTPLGIRRAVHPVRRPAHRLRRLPVLRAVTDPQGGGCYRPGWLGEGRGSPRKVPYAKTAHDEQLAGRL